MSPENEHHNDLHDPLVLLQRIHHWRTAFFGLIVLLAGIAIGGSGMFMWERHKVTKNRATRANVAIKPTQVPVNTPWGRLIVSLKKHLDLSDKQVREILPILRIHMTQLDKIKREARPRIAEQLTQMNGKITPILNDKQKRLWNQDFRKLRQQFHLDFTQNISRPQGDQPRKTDARKRTNQAKKNTDSKPSSEATKPTKKPASQRKPAQSSN